MINIDDISSYKVCKRKQYDIYVCLPPDGTIVINKLEQPDLVRQLNGKTFFTITELNKLKDDNSGLYLTLSHLASNNKIYVTNSKSPFVICGTTGELYTISASMLASEYTFLHDNRPVPINNQTLNSRIKSSLMNWNCIRVANAYLMNQTMACFVPVSQKGQVLCSDGKYKIFNQAGVSHGKGDFIVCPMLPNRQPDLSKRTIINGDVFASTYNNQGWQDKLKYNNYQMRIDSLPKLVSLDDNKDLLSEFNTFYENFKSEISSIIDVIESKDYNNNNKLLKVNGDNDDSLSLRFVIDGGKVIISGKSDKIVFDKVYKLDNSDVSTAVNDVLNSLKVSPLRGKIKLLPEYINSKGEYRCSKISFKSSERVFVQIYNR